MNDLPGDLTGTNPLVPWLNKLKAAVARRTLLPGTGYAREETTGGVILRVKPGGPGGGVSGLTYEGDYSATRVYSAGMIVRKRLGTSQGVYICVQQTTPGIAPEFPENAFWHLWVLAPVPYTECNDDPAQPQRTIYVHASDQFS